MAGVGVVGLPGGAVAWWWANLGREFGLQLSDLSNRVDLVPASAFMCTHQTLTGFGQIHCRLGGKGRKEESRWHIVVVAFMFNLTFWIVFLYLVKFSQYKYMLL